LKTFITMVLDRSGSMGIIKSSTIEGVNSFIAKQREVEGECKFTLWQFDDLHEKTFFAEDIKKVPYLDDTTFVPRGWTALHDAICLAVDETGLYLDGLSAEEKPDAVLFVIVTDGFENASKEFNSDAVKQRIQHQTEKYSWDFSYLGANQDAVVTGAKMGFAMNKSMTFAANRTGSTAAFDSVTDYHTKLRNMDSNQYLGAVASCGFTDEDRENQLKAGFDSQETV